MFESMISSSCLFSVSLVTLQPLTSYHGTSIQSSTIVKVVDGFQHFISIKPIPRKFLSRRLSTPVCLYMADSPLARLVCYEFLE